MSQPICIEYIGAEMHSGIYKQINMKYHNNAILLTLRLFRHFPGILGFLERPVKHKHESVPRIGIDNSDS